MKKKTQYRFSAKLWIYPGETANWHFVHVPKKESAEIYTNFKGQVRGWNSHRVSVRIQKTAWQTSIFWDKKSSAYLLPIKADIRKREGLFAGDTANITLRIQV